MNLGPEPAVRSFRLRVRYAELFKWSFRKWLGVRQLDYICQTEADRQPQDADELNSRGGKPIPFNRRYVTKFSELGFDQKTLEKLREGQIILNNITPVLMQLSDLRSVLNRARPEIENLKKALCEPIARCNPRSSEYDRWFRLGFERLKDSRTLAGTQFGVLLGTVLGLTLTAWILPVSGQVVTIFGAIWVGCKIASVLDRIQAGFQVWSDVARIVRVFSLINNFPRENVRQILRERSPETLLKNLKNQFTQHLQRMLPDLNTELINRSVDQLFEDDCLR